MKSLFWVLPRSLVLDSWMGSQQPVFKQTPMFKSLKHQTGLVHMVHPCFSFAETWSFPEANGVELCFHQASKFIQWNNSAREQVPTGTWVFPDPSLTSHCRNSQRAGISHSVAAVPGQVLHSRVLCKTMLQFLKLLLQAAWWRTVLFSGNRWIYISAKRQIQFALAGRTATGSATQRTVVVPSLSGYSFP